MHARLPSLEAAGLRLGRQRGWGQQGWGQQLKQVSLPRQNMGSEKVEPLQDVSKSGEGDGQWLLSRH